jgi:hypothetical protein
MIEPYECILQFALLALNCRSQFSWPSIGMDQSRFLKITLDDFGFGQGCKSLPFISKDVGCIANQWAFQYVSTSISKAKHHIIAEAAYSYSNKVWPMSGNLPYAKLRHGTGIFWQSLKVISQSSCDTSIWKLARGKNPPVYPLNCNGGSQILVDDLKAIKNL